MSSAQRKIFTHRERYELHWSRFCVLTAALINDDRDNESIRIALALMSGIFRGKFGSLLLLADAKELGVGVVCAWFEETRDGKFVQKVVNPTP